MGRINPLWDNRRGGLGGTFLKPGGGGKFLGPQERGGRPRWGALLRAFGGASRRENWEAFLKKGWGVGNFCKRAPRWAISSRETLFWGLGVPHKKFGNQGFPSKKGAKTLLASKKISRPRGDPPGEKLGGPHPRRIPPKNPPKKGLSRRVFFKNEARRFSPRGGFLKRRPF